MVEYHQLAGSLQAVRAKRRLTVMIRTPELEQRLPITRDEAWEFFSSPANLNEITPADLGFEKFRRSSVITPVSAILTPLRPIKLGIPTCRHNPHKHSRSRHYRQ